MKKPKYLVFWTVALGLLIIDQLTKYWVQMVVSSHDQGTLYEFGQMLALVYVENTGAAWGAFAGSGTVLGILAVVALGTIFFLRDVLQIFKPIMQVAFGLLTAGITGNMIDRLSLGYVVDFIDLRFGDFHFPAFNIADMAITFGVILYIIYGNVTEGSKGKDPTLKPNV